MKAFYFFHRRKKNKGTNSDTSKRRESLFLHLTCNLVIACVVVSVFFMSIFSPISVETSSSASGAIYRGNPQNSNVSLMINVYWGTEFLDGILDVLDQEEAKVTFFVGGSWVTKNSEMLLKLDSHGHEIASHSYNHKDHAKISREAQKKEIEMTQTIVNATIGKSPSLFAPPSGSYNKTTLEICNSLGLKVIMWSKDTIDWRDHDTNLILSRATKNLENGDMILMHPTKNTLEALPQILKTIKSQGFSLTTVSENIA